MKRNIPQCREGPGSDFFTLIAVSNVILIAHVVRIKDFDKVLKVQFIEKKNTFLKFKMGVCTYD